MQLTIFVPPGRLCRPIRQEFEREMNSSSDRGRTTARYLIRTWAFPRLTRLSLFRCSTKVTCFFISNHNPECFPPIGRRGSRKGAREEEEEAAGPETRPELWLPVTEQIRLNPECSHPLCKNTQNNYPSLYTIYWASCPIYIALTQTEEKPTGNGWWAPGWIAVFRAYCFMTFLNAPNLCKYSEHRSEEVMVG